MQRTFKKISKIGLMEVVFTSRLIFLKFAVENPTLFAIQGPALNKSGSLLV